MITGTANKIKSQVQASMKELEALESEAAKLRDTIEGYESARERNHTTETRKAALLSEREDLKLSYTEALYEDARDEIEAIHERREAIDAELSELEPVDVPQLDGFALADLKWRAEHTDFVYVKELIKLVSDELQTLKGQHHNRKRAAVESFSKYITTDDEHSVKMERDVDYSKRERVWEEQEEKRKADNVRAYGVEEPSFNNTDELLEAKARAKRKRLANA